LPDLTLPLLAMTAGAIWVVGLWYLGAYTHPAVLGWRRLSRLRGLQDLRPFGDRLGDRLPLLRRAQAETDVGRLLAVAGRQESASGWLLRVAFQAGLALATILLIDELGIVSGQPIPLSPGIGLLAAASISLLAYARLRRQAADYQAALGRAVADSLPHLAVMTFHHRVPASEALLIFARCQRDSKLHELLAGDSWRSLVDREIQLPDSRDGAAIPESTALMYKRIGQAYGVPMFVALGSAVRRIAERGLPAQDVYTGLARATYSARLAEARVAAAHAKTLIVVPMGFMIVPVLVLIGAPLVASLAGIFAR
jgi:hypothetical protein